MERYAILGAGGSIGTPLMIELLRNKKAVRLVSRRNAPWQDAESFKGDLTSARDTLDAVKDCDVAFLCAGLPYVTKIWRELWPRVMSNTIEACKRHKVRLIFVDNVYMYGKVDGKMTEETPYHPCGRKGEIRAGIALQLMKETKEGNLQASIARSADFYGPYATRTSVPYILVIDRLRKGQKAQWLVNVHALHSYTYTLDCARALFVLATHPESFNQVWHLPTMHPPITGTTFIEIAAKELGVTPRYSVLSKWMLRLAGLGDTTIRESYEMLYQSEFDYYFDSTKFERHFNYSPTSYAEGIAGAVRFKDTN